MIFLDELNTKTGGKYHFLRVKSCLIQKTKALVEIDMLVPDYCYSIFSDQDKQEIHDVVRTIIPDNLSYVIKYTKSCIDKDVVRKFLFDYMDKNCPMIAFNSLDINAIIEENKVLIEIKVKEVFYEYLASGDFSAKVTSYFEHCIYKPVEVRVIKVAGKVDFGELIQQQEDEMDVYVMRRVRTSEHIKVRGKSIIGSPKYIGDKNQPDDNAIFCGKIVDYQRRVAKSGNPFYKMKIDDTTGVLIIVGFTKSPGVSVYDELKIDDEIIVMGKLSPDSYAKDLTLMINSLSRCVIDYDSIVTKKPFKTVPKSYKIVSPEKYVDVVQLNFLEEKSSAPPDRLLGQTFVVFDLETTGLNPNADKVIEIGAVKMVDGVITETFTALCDPQQPLEEKIIDITGLTDNMLMGMPTFEEIFPDFYKFSRDSVLVAHNAPFDVGFINRYAKELNYNIDNAVLDTIKLAQQCIISPNYRLGTLCKELNIDLTNAHRAVHDATATAKLFIEIARRKAFDV